jgi:hypothetical protein
MNKAWLLLLLAGCAHERAGIAKALECPSVTEVARAEARPLEVPRKSDGVVQGVKAIGVAMEVLTKLIAAAQAKSAGPQWMPVFTPTGEGAQISMPGWRQYEGCSAAAVCFDGGWCSTTHDAKELAKTRSVTTLMWRSQSELNQKLSGSGPLCPKVAVDRYSVFAWTLDGCGHSAACYATSESEYSCVGPDGVELSVPAKAVR